MVPRRSVLQGAGHGVLAVASGGLCGLAVPVAEVGGHVGVVHDVAELPACVLVVGGQEVEHVVTVVAAEQPDKSRDPVRGDEVGPFVGGDGGAEEVADAGTLVVAGDPQCAIGLQGGGQVVPRPSRSSRSTMRRAAWPGRG